MLCCVGLFGGLAVGQSLGGPWTLIAPAAGFGIGFLADMKLMKGMHGKAAPQPAQADAANEAPPAPEIHSSEGKPAYPVQDLGKV
jgi:hypothetical protein